MSYDIKPWHKITPLKRWLFEHGESASAFARRTGISGSWVYAIAKGTKRPSLDMAEKIREATGGEITANDL